MYVDEVLVYAAPSRRQPLRRYKVVTTRTSRRFAADQGSQLVDNGLTGGWLAAKSYVLKCPWLEVRKTAVIILLAPLSYYNLHILNNNIVIPLLARGPFHATS
jgi:hypothetical protein